MKDTRGFTLIELLVSLAVIGLLSSLIFSNLSVARKRARDARKIEDVRAISTALKAYTISTNQMPPNFNPGRGACEDSYYDQAMQVLVDAGQLHSIPRSPGNGEYCYYNYGKGGPIGGLVVTTLEATQSTTTAITPSCRPFTTNWCSYTQSSRHYCMCNPY